MVLCLTDPSKVKKQRLRTKDRSLSQARESAVPWEPDTTNHGDLTVRVFLLIGLRSRTHPYWKMWKSIEEEDNQSERIGASWTVVSTRWRTKPVKEDANGGIDTETEHQAFRFQLAQRKKPAKVEQRLKPNQLQISAPPFVCWGNLTPKRKKGGLNLGRSQ